MFHVMSMAESSELLVNLHFYVYYLSNSEKAILTYRMIVTTYCFWTDSCTPGTSWQQDCNTCTCTENRTPVCTLRACLPRPVRQLPSETCEPGSTFRKDCNTCTCSDDGRSAACTLRLCLSQTRRRRDVQKCEPGTTYQKDCNTCRCLEDGQNEACTLKFCVPNAGTLVPNSEPQV